MPRMEDAGGSVQGKDAGEMRGRPLPSDTAEVALQVSLTRMLKCPTFAK